MKRKKLINKSLSQFIICIAALFVLTTPVFYWLTKCFYAEDLIEVIDSVRDGQPVPNTDIEDDIIQGIMIQFCLIAVILCIAIIVTIKFISAHLWKPFYKTLDELNKFRLEDNSVSRLPESDIEEFSKLNDALYSLMTNSIKSYRIQKEFTENASHELQTPVAIFKNKLDILLQQDGLTKEQAEIIQDLYTTANRLTRLNKNLLLLAKIENKQFCTTEETDVDRVIDELLSMLKMISGDIKIKKTTSDKAIIIKANKTLLESMLSNLIVNAARHNAPEGQITIALSEKEISVSNTAVNGPLDRKNLFNRFHQSQDSEKDGNGLGLAIVKAICDYHKWGIEYHFNENKHVFIVKF